MLSCQKRHPGAHVLNVQRFAADDGSRFTLLNQPSAEIRAQRETVATKECCEVKLLLLIQLPAIGSCGQKVACALHLPVINRVTGNRDMDGNQPGYVGEPIVGDAVERQFVVTELELPVAIQFVLLAVLQAVKKPVAVSRLKGNPRARLM